MYIGSIFHLTPKPPHLEKVFCTSAAGEYCPDNSIMFPGSGKEGGKHGKIQVAEPCEQGKEKSVFWQHS